MKEFRVVANRWNECNRCRSYKSLVTYRKSPTKFDHPPVNWWWTTWQMFRVGLLLPLFRRRKREPVRCDCHSRKGRCESREASTTTPEWRQFPMQRKSNCPSLAQWRFPMSNSWRLRRWVFLRRTEPELWFDWSWRSSGRKSTSAMTWHRQIQSTSRNLTQFNWKRWPAVFRLFYFI